MCVCVRLCVCVFCLCLHVCLSGCACCACTMLIPLCAHPVCVCVWGGTYRYPDILPNTDTRVNLRVIDNNPIGTYYNANYIRGPSHKRYDYVAAMSCVH